MNRWVLGMMGCALLVQSSAWAQASQTDASVDAAAAVQAEPPVPQADPEAAEQALREAYRKEYAFLTAQVKDIEARLNAFEGTSAEQVRQVEGEISALENELLALGAQTDQLSEDIFQVERSSESAEDNQGILEATIVQARATLTEHDSDPLSDERLSELSQLNQIQQLIQAALALKQTRSTVTREPGQFFLADGREVSGELIRVGNIAAYGHSPEGQGVLAPAGEGRFKVWQQADHEAAAALIAGEAVAAAPIYLYESSLRAAEESEGKTVLSVIESGGIIAWIIAGLGVIALILIVLRSVFLKQASSSTETLLGKVVERIRASDVAGAIGLCSTRKSSNARVLASALRNLDKDRDHLEDIVSESILHESGQLNRFGSLILVIATVSPLLGLLGTVTGMIATFDIITEFGTGDPKLLSGGISIALVTTEIGLAVAIPTLLFGNVLTGWAERIKDDMEKAALRAINVYHDVTGR